MLFSLAVHLSDLSAKKYNVKQSIGFLAVERQYKRLDSYLISVLSVLVQNGQIWANLLFLLFYCVSDAH